MPYAGSRGACKKALLFIGVFFLGSLSIIVDSFLHPEIPHLDPEHLIVGGVTALAAAVLFLLIMRSDEKIFRAQEEWARTFDALRQSEARFRSLVENSLTGIYVLRDDDFIYVNPKLADIFGFTQEEIVFTRSVSSLVAPESRALVAENVRKRMAGEVNSMHYEFKGVRKDGAIIDLEVFGTRTEVDGKPAVIGTLLDITERKKMEDEREEAREFLQTVMDGVSDSILVIGADHKVRMMNRAAREMSLGDSAPSGEPFCYKILHQKNMPCNDKDHPCSLQTVLVTRQPVIVTHTHFTKDGKERSFEILASPVFDKDGNVAQIIESCRDVTDKLILENARKKMEERLFQQQKEQAIVTLAGGIAHDFNNILMGVLGYAEMLKTTLPDGGVERDMADTIMDSSRRMAHLTKQLLAYAKRGDYEQKIVSLNDSVREAMYLTHKDQGGNVRVVLDLTDDLWPVFVDPGQMLQVIINLFTNAFEAIEKSGGLMTVTTANVLNKAAWECAQGRCHAGGDYVHMSVADTGGGITEEVQKKVFEPFFTTKFLGRGLGLAAALGIVQNHNGCISFESAPGAGSTFHIYLPRYKP